MKSKVTVHKNNNMLTFYLKCEEGTGLLFTQKFSKGVYDYFRPGRTDVELHKFRRWGYNPRLDHTIDKCLSASYRRCALEDIAG